MASFKNYPLIIRLTWGLLFIILFLYALIVARNFLYPFVLAILFSYLLYPVGQMLERFKVPRILANLISIFFGLFILAALIFFLYKQLSVFTDDLPELRDQAMKNVDKLERFIEARFGMMNENDDGWLRRNVMELFDVSGTFLRDAFNATAGTLTKIFLIPVYMFFLLYYRDKFKIFFYSLIPGEKHLTAGSIINEMSNVTKRYMGGVVTVILILCVLNSVGLMIVGIQYPILLGILSALFNFIPYFGTLIGGLIPFTMALLTEDSMRSALGVVILFMIIQFTENNILTPNITGGQVRINPFVTILSIIVGGMIWGLPGMFISVPILGMIKIISDHSASLQPYSFLLGTKGTEKHAITWDKIKDGFLRIKNRITGRKKK